MATKLLVVDPSLIESENLYSGDNNIVGVENILPGLKTKCEVIPTGYNAAKWVCKEGSKKLQILSVAIVESNKRAILKGFDLFVDLAKKLPQYEFVFIGLKKGSLDFFYNDIKNLTVFEEVSQEELKKHYCESKVYTQFSLSEGLPNSLCEAMLCECIPIGSSVSGIPNCIGDTGFILTKKDIDQAAELIILAMSASEDLGLKARQRIIQLFPENQREEKLKLLMQSY
jgi:glycosyltransferase involved in cell wall biosynthesis